MGKKRNEKILRRINPHGDTSGLRGNVSDLSGEISSGLCGDVSGLSGEISRGLTGNMGEDVK